MNFERSAQRLPCCIKAEENDVTPLPYKSCLDNIGQTSFAEMPLRNNDEPTDIKIELFGEIKSTLKGDNILINNSCGNSAGGHKKVERKYDTSLNAMDSIEGILGSKPISNSAASTNVQDLHVDVHLNEEVAAPQMHQVEMPPLCNTILTTPNLSFQFSPLLTFSEERGSNGNGFPRQFVEVVGSAEETKEAHQQPEDMGVSIDNQMTTASSCSIEEEGGSFTTPSWTPSDMKSITTDLKSNSLTYADNLLLSASQARQLIMSSPRQQKIKSPKATKKRKTPKLFRSNRQPQKRFSVELESNDATDGDLFVSKRDGRVRLTTNLPRAVEALDPATLTRIHSYASCSEAAREMGINRTRMSRSKFYGICNCRCRLICSINNSNAVLQPVEEVEVKSVTSFIK